MHFLNQMAYGKIHIGHNKSNFLGNIQTGVLYGDCEGLVMLLLITSFTWRVISSLCTGYVFN